MRFSTFAVFFTAYFARQASAFFQTEPCTLGELAGININGTSINYEETWKCTLGFNDAATAGVSQVDIDGMDNIIDSGYQIVPGETTFYCPDAIIENAVLNVPNPSSPYFIGGIAKMGTGNGAGARASGTRSILVVNVETNDGPAYYTADQLSGHLFDNTLSVANQMDKCSFGQLEIIPATGDGVVNGVFNLKLNENSNAVSSDTMYEKAKTATAEALGVNLGNTYDFVMFCFPENVDFGGAAAWAYVNHWGSAFDGYYAGAVGVIIVSLFL